MIVIKIKTWKDWKNDFIDWVKEPRRKTCKEYVNYMEALQEQTLYKIIEELVIDTTICVRVKSTTSSKL